MAGDVKERARLTLAKYGGTEPPKAEATFLAFEMDAARRLIDEHGEDLHYVTDIGWYQWAGSHWRQDETELVRERVKKVAGEIRAEAAEVNDEHLWRFAKGIGSANGVKHVLELARSDPRVRISVDKLDSKPHLLACENGVIDLTTGDLREARREDLLTRCAPTAYRPDAKHEGFSKILEHLIPSDEDRAYTHRAFGHALYGAPTEDVIFLLIGPPRSGKGTLLRALREALGEHYAEVNMRSFCFDRRGAGGNPARSDLFRLIGRRIVAASEISPGLMFDSGQLKAIAGGDKMPVRRLHKDEIEAAVSFTLFLVCNDGDLPKLRAEDEGLWERIRRIPIGSTVPEDQRDPAIRESMATAPAKEAALAWMVAGAALYHREGLGNAPQSVKKAGTALREEMDDLGPFIRAHIVFHPEATTPRAHIREAIEEWVGGDKPPNSKAVHAALRAAAERVGVKLETTSARVPGRSKPVRAIRGVELVLGGK